MTGIQTLLSVTPDGCFNNCTRFMGLAFACECMGACELDTFFEKWVPKIGGRVNFLPSRYRESHRESF